MRQIVARGERAIDAALGLGVAPGPPAVDGVHMLRAAAEDAERHGEAVARADLGDAAGKTLKPAIGEVIAIDAVDIGEGGVDIEVFMARAGTGREGACREAAARPPIVEKIISASKRHAALDEDAERHARNDSNGLT